MVATLALAGLGLVILLLAGDILVKAAVNLGLRLGVPPLIVSLTIVSFGTSAPELLIAIQSVLDGVPGLALGNVVGSNIANIFLVLGVPALIASLTSETDTRWNYALMLGGSFLFIGLAFTGPMTWWHGLILLSALALVLIHAGWCAHTHRQDTNDTLPDGDTPEGADPKMTGPWIAFYLILGLIGLPVGADMLVHHSVIVARDFGVSETVIGLTLVAVGTSLPELATTVMAVMRRHSDVALGNVIGSNTFNLLAIIGIATLVGPIPVDASILAFDLWVMLGASILLIPFVFFGRRMGRRVGVVFCGLYISYLWMIF